MELIEKAKKYVQNCFLNSDSQSLHYHNWEHTIAVYNDSVEICKNSAKISEADQFKIELAALFHDVGYTESSHEDHEIKGAEIAQRFLKENQQSEELIEGVKHLILATKLSHTPKNSLEEVIIDADLAHLGKENYLETTFKKLPIELKDCLNKKFSTVEWVESCINFLSSHNYLTSYAREKYGSIKEENIQKLKNKLNDLIKNKKNKTMENKDKVVSPAKKGQKNPLKGVETMFKTSLRNHIDLSSIADKKANTLISVNAIVISIVLSGLFPKMDSNPFLFYPSVTILISSLLTILLAILSTIPHVTSGRVSKEDVENKKGNLLFFGNFHKMKFEDYLWSVKELMESKDYIYSSMTNDLFFLGKVLNRKYTLLRFSYFIFIIGLFVSIFIFINTVIPYIGSTSDIDIGGIQLW